MYFKKFIENSTAELAQTHLRKSLIERDASCKFDRQIFELFTEKTVVAADKADASNVIKHFFSIGYGGLDLPFSISVVAQFIGVQLLRKFTQPHADIFNLSQFEKGQKILGIGNSETMSGTDLKQTQSKIYSKNSHYKLDLKKPCMTNGPADFVLVSAWDTTVVPASCEVLLLGADQIQQSDLRQTMNGFRTGLTGSVEAHELPINLQTCRLGASGSGFEILKFCFHMERLLTAASVAGVATGLLRHLLTAASTRTSMGRPLIEHQYIQDKFVSLFAEINQLLALCESIGQDKDQADLTFDQSADLLATCKLLIVSDLLPAVEQATEVLGYENSNSKSIPSKVISDLRLMKFLGGTKELQKIHLFRNLTNELKEKAHEKKSA